MSHPKPVSLLAERAVRYLRNTSKSIDSRTLVHELLSTRTADESAARQLLETGFAGDHRLVYERGCWTAAGRPARDEPGGAPDALEPERVLVFVRGSQPDPFICN